jgi:hypothetical protein
LAYLSYFEKLKKAYEITLMSVPPPPQRLKAECVEPEFLAGAKPRLGKHSRGNKYACNHTRTAGHGIFYVVRAVSDSQYAVKG